MSEKETRVMALEQMEVRRGEGEKPVIRGYAAVFNSLSEDLGGFRERIAPGAFGRSLKENDIRALWDHDSKYVLGRNTRGTLALAEDERGLAVEIEPPGTQWANDLMAMIDRGDVDQMSFGFYARDERWENTDGGPVRTLLDANLFDVSVVAFPAYGATEVSVEARNEAMALARAGRVEGKRGESGARARLENKRKQIETLELEVMR